MTVDSRALHAYGALSMTDRAPTGSWATYHWRAKIGVALLIAFALMSDVQLLRTVRSRLVTAPPDDLSRHEVRLRNLRSALPPRGVVGYVTDPEELPTSRPADDLPARRFLWTRYVLSPVIVLQGQAPQLVVGNFYASTPSIPASLVVVKDFGEGVLLFRHRESRSAECRQC